MHRLETVSIPGFSVKMWPAIFIAGGRITGCKEEFPGDRLVGATP